MSQDMKLDELLEKYLKTIGQDKFAKIQTIKITGKMVYPNGAEFSMTVIKKHPNLDRTEMEFQGTRIIAVFDGQTGWMINPVSGSLDPQDMSADMLNSNEKDNQKDPFSIWNNPFFDWKENGNKIELVGKEDLNGTPVYNLKMTFNESDVVNYYMDIAKFVILKMKEKSTIQGQIAEVETIFSDFRDVDGIMYPFRYEILYNSQSAVVITVDKIEFNLPVDDAIFKKPEVNKK